MKYVHESNISFTSMLEWTRVDVKVVDEPVGLKADRKNVTWNNIVGFTFFEYFYINLEQQHACMNVIYS